VPYFHVVFTLPAPIRRHRYQNKVVIYDLLFRESETLYMRRRAREKTEWPVSDRLPDGR
jgi:hypothetical protein